jgi:hypothetical protein
MNKLLHASLQTGKTGLIIGGLWAGMAIAAVALPGQSVQEAEAWMQAHPTLRAEPGERLSIRRNDTPSRRYTFHGSTFEPGGGSLLSRRADGQPVMVRSEKFTLVDLISGVGIARLEDALRTIYGAEVFADYRRSQSLLVYSPGRAEDRGTQRAARSQLSEGELYAYLIEVIPDPDGTIHTGAVTVMLKEDVAPLVEALRNREIERAEFENPTAGPTVRPTASPTVRPIPATTAEPTSDQSVSNAQ